MSYYDNYVDDSAQADVYATSSTEHPFFGPVPQGGGVKKGEILHRERLLVAGYTCRCINCDSIFNKEIQIVIIIT